MPRPNILFLFPDQHRGDWMPYPDGEMAALGMDPLPLRMPNIEGMMARGVTFTRCVSPSPLCAPARSCLASGLRYHRDGVARGNGNSHPLDLKTFYSVLAEGGYTVGGCGKFDLRKPEHYFAGTGWVPKMAKLGFHEGYSIDNGGKHDAIRCATTYADPATGRRKRHANPLKENANCPYMVYLKEKGLMMVHVNDFKKRRRYIHPALATFPTPLPEDAYCDNWIARNATSIIERFPEGKPWFLQVNFVCPHDPWDVTESMKEAWKGVSFPPPVRGSKLFEKQDKKVRQNYAAMLEMLDRNVGLILEAVARRGELENTLVVYSSDHGEMLGDFKRYKKSRPERGASNVPLVVSGAGVSARGKVTRALVETQDLVATFIELAGLSMPSAIDSKSLVPILDGSSENHREHQVSQLGRGKINHTWRMVSDGKFKLVEFGDGSRRLHDLDADPWELEDVSAAHESRVESLVASLPPKKQHPRKNDTPQGP